MRSSFTFLGLALASAVSSSCSPEPETAPTPASEETGTSNEGSSTATGWIEEAGARGLVHSTDSGSDGKFGFPEITVGGVGLFDADADGDIDVYLVDGGSVTEDLRGGRDRLFLNGGDARFTDHTDESGVRRSHYGMGAMAGDVNGDGAVDLYLSSVGPDQWYLQDRPAHFQAASDSVVADGWSTSTSFFDVDADGDLDLYVCRYIELRLERICLDGTDRLEYCTPTSFDAVADVFLVNDGTGRFRDASAEYGITETQRAGLGVVAQDFDEDGDLDLYVANDQTANNLWSNEEGERFVDRALARGVALSGTGKAEASMGIVLADLDGRNGEDLFVTHVHDESNTFYRSMGAGRGFSDDTGSTGTVRHSVPLTGFGVNGIDADHDGDVDLLVANGSVRRAAKPPVAPLLEPWPAYAQVDHYYENVGGRFEAPVVLGETPFVSRGSAHGDLDGDGDQDWIVVPTDGPVRLFMNRVPKVGAWLGLELRDGPRSAEGARVRVSSGEFARSFTVRRDGSYLASNDPRWFGGLPQGVDGPFRVEVAWVGGESEVFELVEASRLHRLARGAGAKSD